MLKSFHSKIVYEQGALLLWKSIEYSHETVKYLKLSYGNTKHKLIY